QAPVHGHPPVCDPEPQLYGSGKERDGAEDDVHEQRAATPGVLLCVVAGGKKIWRRGGGEEGERCGRRQRNQSGRTTKRAAWRRRFRNGNRHVSLLVPRI